MVEAVGIVYPELVEGNPRPKEAANGRYEWLGLFRGRHGGRLRDLAASPAFQRRLCLPHRRRLVLRPPDVTHYNYCHFRDLLRRLAEKGA